MKTVMATGTTDGNELFPKSPPDGLQLLKERESKGKNGNKFAMVALKTVRKDTSQPRKPQTVVRRTLVHQPTTPGHI